MPAAPYVHALDVLSTALVNEVVTVTGALPQYQTQSPKITFRAGYQAYTRTEMLLPSDLVQRIRGALFKGSDQSRQTLLFPRVLQ